MGIFNTIIYLGNEYIFYLRLNAKMLKNHQAKRVINPLYCSSQTNYKLNN